MGVQNFSKTFAATREVEYKDFKSKKLYMDTMIEIFRTSAVGHQTGMKNAKGEPTSHIKATINNLKKMASLNIKSMWGFDSKKSAAFKAPELEIRAEKREIAKSKVEAAEEELKELQIVKSTLSSDELNELDPTFDTTFKAKQQELDKLKAQNPQDGVFGKFVRDIRFILDCLGIMYVTAPDGFDAEQLGAWFSNLPDDNEMKVDAIVSTDADTLLYGGTRIMKKIQGKTGKYKLFELATCLSQHSLTMDQFIKVGVALGTDAQNKSPGVGPKTVITKVKAGLEFTDSQKETITHFTIHIPANYKPNIIQKKRTAESIKALRDWLITEQNFGEDGVDKDLLVLA